MQNAVLLQDYAGAHRNADESRRYAQCIDVSKRVRWDIDRDVIRGRHFDLFRKFLPDGLSKVDELDFLTEDEQRLLSQIQGRTYANMFGLVERFIGAKMVEVARSTAWATRRRSRPWSDSRTRSSSIRNCSAASRRLPAPTCRRATTSAAAAERGGLAGARQGRLGRAGADPAHSSSSPSRPYRQSVEPDQSLSPLFKDVLLYHWREESQHAILDELEWRRYDAAHRRRA